MAGSMEPTVVETRAIRDGQITLGTELNHCETRAIRDGQITLGTKPHALKSRVISIDFRSLLC